MMIMLCVFCLVLLCLIVVSGMAMRYIFRSDSPALAAEPAFERSPEFYMPMERLLSEQDFHFLASRPGVTPQLVSRVYRERRQIFRQYLRFLRADFTMVTASIRALMVASEISRGDLAITLVRARLLFALGTIAIEVRLLLHACGFHGQPIHVIPLTAALTKMRLELALLAPVPAL